MAADIGHQLFLEILANELQNLVKGLLSLALLPEMKVIWVDMPKDIPCKLNILNDI